MIYFKKIYCERKLLNIQRVKTDNKIKKNNNKKKKIYILQFKINIKYGILLSLLFFKYRIYINKLINIQHI